MFHNGARVTSCTTKISRGNKARCDFEMFCFPNWQLLVAIDGQGHGLGESQKKIV